MNYIFNLIKAHKALIKAYRSLQSQLKSLESSQDLEDSYATKFNIVNRENLSLKEQVAKLELDIFHLTKELEKRNALIQTLKNDN